MTNDTNDEIQVTEEMIKAGRSVLARWNVHEDDWSDIVAIIFEDMLKVYRKNCSLSRSSKTKRD